jgi:creatinine amidohydrolase
MYAQEISWEEFKSQKRKVCVLVFGAMEPHGKHLPLSVDNIIPWELAKRLEKKKDVLLFPPINFGYLYSMKKFPGAVSVSFDSLKNYSKDIFASLLKEGFMRFLIIIGHGGNTAPVKYALRELSETHKFRACLVEWWMLIKEEAGHADEVEASLTLAAGGSLRAKPVQEKSKDYVGEIIPTPDDLFTPSGYHGKIGNISKERGEELMNTIVEKFAKILDADLQLERKE